MKHCKIALLALVCLLCALTLCACHTDADPWPASQPTEGAPAATEGGATGGEWAFPGGGATTAPVDTHELDNSTDPGLNG